MRAIKAKTKQRDDIQVLRAFAVLLVVCYHFEIQGFQYGFIGVDIFLVVSGYLVGGSLLKQLDRTGRLELGRFLASRARRIFPAAVAVIIATLVLLELSSQLTSRDLRQALWSSLYIQNVNLQFEGVEYSAADLSQGYFVHFWSLALEEQFYVLVPLVLLLGQRLLRAGIFGLVISLTILSLAYSLWTTMQGDPASYFSLFSRAWQFGFGMLASKLVMSKRRSTAAWWIAIFSLTTFVTLLALFPDLLFPAPGAVLPSIFAATFLAAGLSRPFRIPLSAVERALVAVGNSSYSIYLVHFGISIVVLSLPKSPNHTYAIFAGILLTIALGFLSKKCIEDPFRKIWPSGRSWQTPLIIGVALIVVPISIGVALFTMMRASEISSSHVSDQARSCLGAQALISQSCEEFEHAAMTIDPATMSESLYETYRNKCHIPQKNPVYKTCSYGEVQDFNATVALIGDSHATQWLPALDIAGKELGIRIHTYTMGGCSLGYSSNIASSKDDVCMAYVDWVRDSIGSSNGVYDAILHSAIVHVKDKEEDFFTRRLKAFESQLTFLESHSSSVLVVRDNPWGGLSKDDDPNLCLLSKVPEACTNKTEDVIFPSPYERAVQNTGIGRVVDTRALFCSRDYCGTGIGGVPVYRDYNHISVPYSETTSSFWIQELGYLVSQG